jgi:hypothetical protein
MEPAWMMASFIYLRMNQPKSICKLHVDDLQRLQRMIVQRTQEHFVNLESCMLLLFSIGALYLLLEHPSVIGNERHSLIVHFLTENHQSLDLNSTTTG